MSSRADTILTRYLQGVDIPGWPVDVDTENLVVIRVSEGGVEFCCGGDWQEPRRMLLYVVGQEQRVREVEGETCFPDIEIDDKSLQGLEEWINES